MEIIKMICDHFALLTNKKFYTPSQGKEFSIKNVSTHEGNFPITLIISTSNPTDVYPSDILAVYTHITSYPRPLSQTEIQNHFEGKLITGGRIPYILPLLSTFPDIEVITEPEYGIRFKPVRET